MPLPVSGPSWTLFPNGLLAFVRPAQGDKLERLLLSRVDFCTTKGCMCRDVGLRSLEYDVAAFRAAPPEDLATRLARAQPWSPASTSTSAPSAPTTSRAASR